MEFDMSTFIDQEIPLSMIPADDAFAEAFPGNITIGGTWSSEEDISLDHGVREQAHHLVVARLLLNAPVSDEFSFPSISPDDITAQQLQETADAIDWEAIALQHVPSRTSLECQYRWGELNNSASSSRFDSDSDHQTAGWSDDAANRADSVCASDMSAQVHAASLTPQGPVPNTRGKWSTEEDRRLLDAIKQYGDSQHWRQVADKVGTRTPAQCMHRWRHSLTPCISHCKWSQAEDRRLCEAVLRFGHHWASIAQIMPGRTGAQCRERFCNKLDPSIYHGTWSDEEDRHLRVLVEQMGVGHWAKVARALNPPRTDYQARKRWFTLVKRESKPEVSSTPAVELMPQMEGLMPQHSLLNLW